MFCKKCGAKIESYASHCPFCGVAVEQNSVEATYTAPKGEVKKKKKAPGVAKRVILFLVCATAIVGAVVGALYLLK